MQRNTSLASALALALGLAGATAWPAHAAGPALTLGSSLGLDTFSRRGESVFVLSSSAPPPFFTPAVEPGLRIGTTAFDDRLEIAALTGLTMIGFEGGTASTFGITLDGNYCLTRDPVVRPYLGLHAGVAGLGTFGEEIGGDALTSFGGQLGIRRMVADGHGDVRLELRASAINGPDASAGTLTGLGVRLGYDLWLR